MLVFAGLVACSGDTANSDPEEVEPSVDEETADDDEQPQGNNTETESEEEHPQENGQEPDREEESISDDEQLNEQETSDEQTTPEVVAENDAFQIYEPAPNAEVGGEFVVHGAARVHDGNVHYEFEDGHNILDQGTTTATAAAPEWGEFEFTINFSDVANNSGTVFLFEEREDGTRSNQIHIPVSVPE